MGSSPVARRYWGNHFCFLFLRVLRCFSSPGSPPPIRRMAVRQTAGLPHSGTPGSMTACVSPGLFAACRALHRQYAPRHPPWTYVSLDHIASPPGASPRTDRSFLQASSRSVLAAPGVLHFLPFSCNFKYQYVIPFLVDKKGKERRRTFTDTRS